LHKVDVVILNEQPLEVVEDTLFRVLNVEFLADRLH
jgi:hypothetical protein